MKTSIQLLKTGEYVVSRRSTAMKDMSLFGSLLGKLCRQAAAQDYGWNSFEDAFKNGTFFNARRK